MTWLRNGALRSILTLNRIQHGGRKPEILIDFMNADNDHWIFGSMLARNNISTATHNYVFWVQKLIGAIVHTVRANRKWNIQNGGGHYAKPDIFITQLVDKISTKFQRAKPIFSQSSNPVKQL